LHGTPRFYNALNTQLSTSNYSIRHLFTGQQWYSELGLYDLRNRFYSPDVGRFLQPDPVGFWGDPSNIYRYVGNNPINRSDPSGLGTSNTIYRPNEPMPGPLAPGWTQAMLDRVTTATAPVVVIGNPVAQALGNMLGGVGSSPGDAGGGSHGGGNGKDKSKEKEKEKDPCVITPASLLRAISHILDLASQFADPGASVPPRVVNITAAYSEAHDMRSEGHLIFPGQSEPNDSLRHQWAGYTATQAFGPTTARDLGVLNEVQGIYLDLRFQPVPPAFQMRDLLNNEIGIWTAILCD
jgi:RHS repeat-associated protein